MEDGYEEYCNGIRKTRRKYRWLSDQLKNIFEVRWMIISQDRRY